MLQLTLSRVGTWSAEILKFRLGSWEAGKFPVWAIDFAQHWSYVVPVGEWVGKRGSPLGCPLFSSPIESLRHCLWDCSQAQKVWDRVTHLLAACEVEGIASWSVATWIDHSVDRWTDAFNADSWCYVCMRGKMDVDRGLNLVVGLESTMPKGLPSSGLAARGSDHGYMVRSYQLPTRAIGRG